MSIRITGMYSGLDTESIISELASAQSFKKNSLVKAQTKLSWKMNAWSSLNTKVYSFYSGSLSDMRFESSFGKKSTKVSHSSAVSVVTGDVAPAGVQSLKINNLSKAGYLTGAKLSTDTTSYSKSSTLTDLGLNPDTNGTITLTTGGKTTEIEVDNSTTIGSFIDKLQAAGVNANFDEKNQRIFVSASASGEKADFQLSAANDGGLKALSKMGILDKDGIVDKTTQTWAAYYDGEDFTDAFRTMLSDSIAAEAKKRADAAYEENQKLGSRDDLATALSEAEAARDEKQIAKDTAKTALDAFADAEGNVPDDVKETEEYKAALEAYNTASSEFDKAQEDYDKAQGNLTKYDENAAKFEVSAEGDVSATTALTDEVTSELTASYEARAKFAYKMENDDTTYKNLASDCKKVAGKDASITFNEVEYTSSTNTFDINGLTMTMLTECDEEISLTTAADTEGIYDMIKTFFSDYNKLINEMDSMYNAESAKGYEPLTSEEKAAMTDKEVEEWEEKVKSALLRRDSELSSLADAMKNVFLQGFEVNGKKMYLADFGISTLGYFNSADNEKNAYHIDGNKDDASTKGNTDKLSAMIASDPDTVTSFFTQLSQSLYSALSDKMSRSSMSSAYTVYNDKQLKEEYDKYSEKITAQEDKINDLMDSWYSKFSKMETAMSKLDSTSNSLASLLGG